MVKPSPEVKKLADKYCNEQGGPPKAEEPHLIVEGAADFTEVESRTVFWWDEWSKIPPSDWYGHTPSDWSKFLISPPIKIRRRPGTKLVVTLPKPKSSPEKPWTKFNPTPKNPKRGPR